MSTQSHSISQGNDRRNLESAFRSFSEVSAQLANSYQTLQDHVSVLQLELLESNREKTRAAEDKQNLATRLEHLLELLPGGVVVLDSHGKVEQCNPTAKEFLGQDLLGSPWLKIIEDNFSPRIDDGHEISLKDGRRLSIATRSMDDTVSMPDADGVTGKGQLILLTDQTDTRELQEKLARRDRLSTMGKMVAYLAHQIRTPLSSAMLYGGHLGNPQLDHLKRTDFAAKLVRQLKNVEQQISDLLIFARGDEVTRQTLTVAELFKRLDKEIEISQDAAAFTVSYRNRAAAVELNCNPQTLISAILNLVNNAHEASEDAEGKKRLEITISAEVQDQSLTICISDNGPGIAGSEIGRVLEPFYSTKAKGTGLGLAVVQAVAKSLGGNLTLTSGEVGVEVRLIIPLQNGAGGR